MDKIIINSAGHAYYRMFRDLYMISFPVFEQRTDEQQDDAFSCLNYHLNAYAEDGCFIGFISYWEFSDYIYIEHFAINQSLRGKGHGYRILQRFISEASKMVLLEIDPITDEVSEARFIKGAVFIRILIRTYILLTGVAAKDILCSSLQRSVR